jgi:hypothetical protein
MAISNESLLVGIKCGVTIGFTQSRQDPQRSLRLCDPLRLCVKRVLPAFDSKSL